MYRGAIKIENNAKNTREFDAFSEGAALFIDGKFEDSINRFSKAIKANPKFQKAYLSRGTTLSEMGDLDSAGGDMVTAARLGEAHLQGFADYHNIWRTKYDKTIAELTGEREADWAVTPDLRSHIDG